MGLFDDAIADYDKALKLNPKRGTSLYGLGVAKLKKGNSIEGKNDIEKARTFYIPEEFIELVEKVRVGG